MSRRSHQQAMEDKAKAGIVRMYRLRSISDGSEMSFVDEGPFETNPLFRTLDASGSRQQLLNIIRKVDADDGLPVFFSDASGQPPVWDRNAGVYVPIPVCSAGVLKKLEDNLRSRKTRESIGTQMLSRASTDLSERTKTAGAPDPVRSDPSVPFIAPATETVDEVTRTIRKASKNTNLGVPSSSP